MPRHGKIFTPHEQRRVDGKNFLKKWWVSPVTSQSPKWKRLQRTSIFFSGIRFAFDIIIIIINNSSKTKKPLSTMETFWQAVPQSQLKERDPAGDVYNFVPFSFVPCCLACPECLGSGVVHELPCVTFVWLSGEQRKGGNWLISPFNRDRSISAVVHVTRLHSAWLWWSFSWQHRKDSREVGIYQHKMNWHERWAESGGGMRLEYEARLGLNCFSRSQGFFFLFWHWKVKEAFPA